MEENTLKKRSPVTVDAQAFWDRLTGLCTANGWSLLELANVTGKPCTHYYSLKRKLSIPSTSYLYDIANALNTSVDYLLGVETTYPEELMKVISLWKTNEGFRTAVNSMAEVFK